MNNEFRKEPDAGKPHVRNSVRDTSGNGRIYSTIEKDCVYLYHGDSCNADTGYSNGICTVDYKYGNV